MRRGSGITVLTVLGVLLATGTAFGVNSRVFEAQGASILGSASQLPPADSTGSSSGSGTTGSADPVSTAAEGSGPVAAGPTAGPQDPVNTPVAAVGNGQTTTNVTVDAAAPAGAGGPQKVTALRVTGAPTARATTPPGSTTRPTRTRTPEPDHSGGSSSGHSDGHGSRSPSPTSSESHDGSGGSGSGGGGSHPADD
jgi:hypothetical protein